jgi:hypothetical protein
LKRRPRAFFAQIAGRAAWSHAAALAALVFSRATAEKRSRRGHATAYATVVL